MKIRGVSEDKQALLERNIRSVALMVSEVMQAGAFIGEICRNLRAAWPWIDRDAIVALQIYGDLLRAGVKTDGEFAVKAVLFSDGREQN